MARGKFGEYLGTPVTSLFTTITGTDKDMAPLISTDEEWLLVARVKPGKHVHKVTDETDNGDPLTYQLQQVAIVKAHAFLPRAGNAKRFDELAKLCKDSEAASEGQQTLDGESGED